MQNNAYKKRGCLKMAEKYDVKKLEEMVGNLTPAEQVALIETADSFRFGGNWGYVRVGQSKYKDTIENLRSEANKNIKFYKVANGVVLLASENFLGHAVNKVAPNALGEGFVKSSKERREAEWAKFDTFLKAVLTGKNKTYKANSKGFIDMQLGLFSVNDTNAIRLNGEEYPAYKLNLVEGITSMQRVLATGEFGNKKIYVRALLNAGTPQEQEVFDEVKNMSNSKALDAMYSGLLISETDTGVFLNIRIL